MMKSSSQSKTRSQASVTSPSKFQALPKRITQKEGRIQAQTQYQMPLKFATSNLGYKRVSFQQASQISDLFKNLVFFIEAFTDSGDSRFESVAQLITSNQGKIATQIGHSVTHFIYENGTQRSLQKTQQEIPQITITTSQWLNDSIMAQKLLDTSNYKAIFSAKEQSNRRVKDKKRPLISIEKQRESQLTNISTSTSKRKPKTSDRLKAEDQLPSSIEEDSYSEVDEDEVERIVKAAQEERFFSKEFEKDLRRFARLKAEVELDESMASRPKRDVKYLSKNQLIDSYIDGEIELPDFVEHMKNKMKSKRQKNSRRAKGNKRLTEMFQPVASKRNQDEDLLLEEEKSGPLNKTAFVSLHDFLLDIDKKDTPNPDKIQQQPSVQQVMKQQQLNFKVQPSLYNYKPGNYLIQDEGMLENKQRITKSSTFGQYSQKMLLQTQIEEGQDLLVKQTRMKRAMTLTPQKSFPISLENKENVMTQMSCEIEEKCRSGVKANHRKRKEWEKILPQRNVPSRVAKQNVSYAEDLFDCQSYIGKANATKQRRNHNYIY